MRVPFFHYTCLESLPGIVQDSKLLARYWLAKKCREFTDISIDPKQPVREQRGLLNYIPLFPGFYTLYRGYEFNGYLMREYDDPKVQNKSFYGTLNKTLQFKQGINYENVIILLVNDALVYDFADKGKVRFFSDIAVKPEAVELPIGTRMDLKDALLKSIDDSNISGEIDLLDDGNVSICCPSDIELIIVDNDKVKQQVDAALAACRTGGKTPQVLISNLPRNSPDE